MIILGLIVIVCCYVVGFISWVFELDSEITANLMIWLSTVVICSLLLYLGAH